MNRIVLLLNVIVLVVTFLVAMAATDSQVGILRSTSAAMDGRRSVVLSDPHATAFLRTVQALPNFLAKERLDGFNGERLDAIHTAIGRYFQVIDAGVTRSLQREGVAGEDLLRVYENMGRDARVEVEGALSPAFSDAATVQRLTTEIIRNCQ